MSLPKKKKKKKNYDSSDDMNDALWMYIIPLIQDVLLA